MTRPSKIVKAAEVRKVLPFPERRAEPLLIDRAMEVNRRQLRENALKRAERWKWLTRIALAVVVAVLLTVWVVR